MINDAPVASVVPAVPAVPAVSVAAESVVFVGSRAGDLRRAASAGRIGRAGRIGHAGRLCAARGSPRCGAFRRDAHRSAAEPGSDGSHAGCDADLVPG